MKEYKKKKGVNNWLFTNVYYSRSGLSRRNLSARSTNLNSFVRYANFFVKNPRKGKVKMTRFDWSRKSRDSCPTSSGYDPVSQPRTQALFSLLSRQVYTDQL